MLRVARFLRSFVRHPVDRVEERDIEIDVAGSAVPATYIRPVGRGAYPGWIVLHGITVPGRRHPVLERFAYALASTGAAVMIPDVPAWRRLMLDPGVGDVTIAAAAAHLRSRADVAGDNLNLVGFSFGATQALMSATHPEIRDSVRAIVGFGGYCDLRRTLLCMMTGEHEWHGVRRRLDPDPYGRWIIAANYLTEVPEFAHMGELKAAAHELAVEAGRQGAYAADPMYDAAKVRLRAALPEEQRVLWDLLAPPAGVTPPLEQGREVAEMLYQATSTNHPDLDPRRVLGSIDQKVVLVHGHDDRLIPYTETLRLREALAPATDVTASITRLFAHSKEAERVAKLQYPREVYRYLTLLRRALAPS